MKKEFEELKSVFREWYGTVSVTELTTNQDLISQIEVIEANFPKIEEEL